MIDRICAVTYWPCLLLAWLDALLAPVSLAGSLRPMMAQSALWITTALVAFHFVMVLWDRATRQTMNAYMEKVLARTAGQVSRQELKALGRRMYASARVRALKWTYMVLVGDMMVILLLMGGRPKPPTEVLLACSAAGLTVLLIQLQMKKTLGLVLGITAA